MSPLRRRHQRNVFTASTVADANVWPPRFVHCAIDAAVRDPTEVGEADVPSVAHQPALGGPSGAAKKPVEAGFKSEISRRDLTRQVSGRLASLYAARSHSPPRGNAPLYAT